MQYRSQLRIRAVTGRGVTAVAAPPPKQRYPSRTPSQCRQELTHRFKTLWVCQAADARGTLGKIGQLLMEVKLESRPS